MTDIMNNLSTFFGSVTTQFQQVSERILAGLSAQHVGLILLALLIVIVVLIILLAVRGRKYNQAMELIDQQVDTIVSAKRDAQAMIDRKIQEQKARESQMLDQIDQREQQSMAAIADKERAFAEKHEELQGLRRFKEKYQGVDDAKLEIKRLLGEAHDYIDELKARTDREYTEIIGHAQEEAAAIREMSQGMMARSHAMLKKTLDRSREIMEDAKREAGLPIAKVPDSVQNALRELGEIDTEVREQDATELVEPDVAQQPTDDAV